MYLTRREGETKSEGRRERREGERQKGNVLMRNGKKKKAQIGRKKRKSGDEGNVEEMGKCTPLE